MICSSYAIDRYTPGTEVDIILGTIKTDVGQQPNGVVYCHGSGATAIDTLNKSEQRTILYGAARHATVVSADYGGETFANDVAITRIGEAIALLRANYGQSGPVILVGASMGAGNALAYAYHHPENVKAVAGIIPMTDIADVMTRMSLIATRVNAAYGGTYNDVTDGPNHSAIHFATGLPANLPIHLWSAPQDVLVPPSVTAAFVAVRPQTGLTTLPPGGHTDASIGNAADAVTQFVRSHQAY